MESNYVIGIGWWYSILVILGIYAIIEWKHMRRDHVISFREATIWSIIYVSLGILYSIPLFVWVGGQAGTEYLAAFFTEKALSLDNLFVFSLIFTAFNVPKNLERRILNYGVVGAIIFRLVFIVVGIALIEKFKWVPVIFGLILLRAAWKAYQDALGKSEQTAITDRKSWKLLKTLIPFSDNFEGRKLVTKVHGKRVFTMLAAVIIMIELTDIIFAVDSVPAVLAISSNRFIAYSSNIFAILGLRALYFVYAPIATKFWALKWGISVILGWISIKLILSPFRLHISSTLNLGVILGILLLSIVLSNSYPGPAKQKK